MLDECTPIPNIFSRQYFLEMIIFPKLLSSITLTWQHFLSRAIHHKWNCLLWFITIRRDEKGTIAVVYCKITDTNSLEAVIHYENVDEHLSLMHCLVCRDMCSPIGVCFHCSSVLSCYAVRVPRVSKGPRFPFQCGPRDTYGTIWSTVSGTLSLTVPIKEVEKTIE